MPKVRVAYSHIHLPSKE